MLYSSGSNSQAGGVWILLAVFFIGILLSLPGPVNAETKATAKPIPVPNPASGLWREVRQRDVISQGKTQVKDVDSGILIGVSGEEFRNYRRSYLVPYAPYALIGAVALIAVFYVIRGRIRIPEGRSGKKVKRFAELERVIHWYVAILFIFLAISGLLLLLGRFFVIPFLGHEVFSVIASASKEGHNLFGPPFLVGLVFMFIRFVSKNIPKSGDLKWLLKGGGILTKTHVSAGFFNAGEKIWFWLVIIFGLLISITGLILVSPVFGQGREVMQLSLVLHGLGALVLIMVALGHIYIGTLGTEGSLESMTTGYVDTNWVKLHHDHWHGEMLAESEQAESEQAPGGTAVTRSVSEARGQP